jgi:ribosomal protein S18 acetylase RimI-like enzyme
MKQSQIVVRMLDSSDEGAFSNIAPDVFDNVVETALTREFLADPRHHMAVALCRGQIVAFASGIHYVHPDKPSELFINEVGVAPSYQRQGIGRRLMAALLAHGAALGCGEAWVCTGPGNTAARSLYAAAGGTEEPEPSVFISFPLAQS